MGAKNQIKISKYKLLPKKVHVFTHIYENQRLVIGDLH